MQEFSGRTAVFATMHGKDAALAELFRERLNIQIIPAPHFDSDVFGTFTRDVKRRGNQREAALAKAHAVAVQGNYDLILASEGTCGPDPLIPFASLNQELLVLIDVGAGRVYESFVRSHDVHMQSGWVTSYDDALRFAEKNDFPAHGIVVRAHPDQNHMMYKNISSQKDFDDAVKYVLAHSQNKKAFLETDMRAHKNPTRMKQIVRAGEQLIDTITHRCVRCSAPGFRTHEVIRGLPCTWCSHPTDIPRAVIRVCDVCDIRVEEPIMPLKHTAEPKYCDWCNP